MVARQLRKREACRLESGYGWKRTEACLAVVMLMGYGGD